MGENSFFGALKGFMQIGIFIGGTGFVLALMQPRDSDEFVVSLCSGFIGLTMVIGVIVVLRLMGPHVDDTETHTDDSEAMPPDSTRSEF